MDKPRHRRTSRFIPIRRVPIKRKSDAFAPFDGPYVCQDDAGRWRDEHYFVDERCLWCGAEETDAEEKVKFGS